MSDVRPIREGIVSSPEKQLLLDYIAGEYDKMTQSLGQPVALVFAFVGTEGGASSGYYTVKEIESCNLLFISRGVQAIQPRWQLNGIRNHDHT